MKILICSNLKKEKTLSVLPEAVRVITECGMTAVMPKSAAAFYNNACVKYVSEPVLLDGVDILLTIGGDGTILKWAKKAALADKPLLGINTGRLGFMTSLEPEELELLARLKSGEYSVSKRMLMKAEIHSENNVKSYLALNDIVLAKDSYSKLPEFSVCSNGFVVSRIRADGLILSTPTGSTAYALSAGGPIIEPDAECMELTPLCAHTLLNRPMIFSGNDKITVSYAGYEGSAVKVSVDGDSGIYLGENDRIEICKSSVTFRLIDINGSSFYDALNNKLLRPLK